MEGVVWVLVVASIALFAVDMAFGADHALAPAVAVADRGILSLFAVELLLRVGSYRPRVLDFFALSPARRLRAHLLGRLGFCLQPLTLVDLATVMALHPALRGLRALRLLRVVRSARLFRYANPLHGTLQAFRDNALLYAFAFTLLMVATMFGGTSIYLVEGQTNPAIGDLADGMWWALVTITTVGFGDIAPVSALGRVVGGVMMVAGMFTLALFAGIVGHTLLNTVMDIREEQFRMSAYVDHVIVCGYDPGARMLLDAMLEEIDTERHHLVLFAPGERPADVPPEYRWVSGDPTKESELDKVRLTHASAVVIVGSRGLSPQQADAATILIAFTLRSYLRKHPTAKQRRQPLYIAAEILDAENVDHARTAGADEVIETTRLGFSLLAHSVVQRGTGDIMSKISSAGAHSLYVGAAPAEVALPAAFGAVAAEVKRRTGALVIGLHDPRKEEDEVNPPDETVVTGEVRLIYLAERAVLPEG